LLPISCGEHPPVSAAGGARRQDGGGRVRNHPLPQPVRRHRRPAFRLARLAAAAPRPMFRALRNILRLLAIARTLARHGALAPLRDVLRGAGLAPAVLLAAELFSRTPRAGEAALRPGERLAAALTELGPAFIKLGQML